MHWQRHKVGAAHWREMAETRRDDAGVHRDRRRSRRRCTRRPRRCRRRSTSSSSPDSCAQTPVQLAKAVTCDLEVPAEAEFVIEGYIDPAEALVTEGPFGDHTGFYSDADLYPQVHVTAITMRRNPIYRGDDRRPAADGGLLPRPRDRADLPAAAQADDPGDRRLSHAGRGDLPQPRVRVDRQAVSRAGVQGDERDVGAGADVAGEGARRRRQG